MKLVKDVFNRNPTSRKTREIKKELGIWKEPPRLCQGTWSFLVQVYSTIGFKLES